GFLFVVSSGLLALGIARRDPWPHAIGAVGTVLVFAIWCAVSAPHGAWVVLIAATSAFVVLYALAPLAARGFDRPLQGESGRAIYAAWVLLMTFTVVARFTPAVAPPLPLLAPMFGLLGIVAWRALAEPVPSLYFVALFFAVVAQGAWTSAHLDLD